MATKHVRKTYIEKRQQSFDVFSEIRYIFWFWGDRNISLMQESWHHNLLRSDYCSNLRKMILIVFGPLSGFRSRSRRQLASFVRNGAGVRISARLGPELISPILNSSRSEQFFKKSCEPEPCQIWPAPKPCSLLIFTSALNCTRVKSSRVNLLIHDSSCESISQVIM